MKSWIVKYSKNVSGTISVVSEKVKADSVSRATKSMYVAYYDSDKRYVEHEVDGEILSIEPA